MFDTAFEENCLALGEPDIYGAFDAYDSDGVICGFSVAMVTNSWNPCNSDIMV